ncbi:MAG: calcium/sodium antiporter [Alphaproteobacteria bacterium]
MTLLNWVTFILGFPALLIGADLLVKGASAIASRLGVSSVVIGLTIVAFGTSAPELLISVQSSLEGRGDMAIGNVVGSNIANILLIIGIAPLVKTFITKNTIKQKDLIFFIVAMVVLVASLAFPVYGRVSAIIGLLVFAFILYNSWENQAADAEAEEIEDNKKPIIIYILYTIIGAIGLAVGADWLVDNGQKIALMMHISPAVVGLIFFAVGTSLPEIATSVYAVKKNEFGLSLGNVIGSNTFNGLLILPAAGLIKPIYVDKLIQIRDLPFLVIATLLLAYIIYKGKAITRISGFCFLGIYAVWIAFVALTASSGV